MNNQDLEQLFQLDDAPGPARPIDDERAAALIAAAISGAKVGPGGGGGGGAKLFLVGGAGALVVTAIAWFAWPSSSPAPPATPHVAVVESPAPLPPTEPPPVVPPPPVVAQPVIVEPPPLAHKPAPKPVAPKTDEPKVEDLLADANRERLAHNWDNADKLYARVVALPHVPPQKVEIALLASASLHLEHFSDPRGATRRFHDALAIKGSLAEDARWGLVEAARAADDTTAERAALDDFLSHHPQSPLAERARTWSNQL